MFQQPLGNGGKSPGGFGPQGNPPKPGFKPKFGGGGKKFGGGGAFNKDKFAGGAKKKFSKFKKPGGNNGGFSRFGN